MKRVLIALILMAVIFGFGAFALYDEMSHVNQLLGQLEDVEKLYGEDKITECEEKLDDIARESQHLFKRLTLYYNHDEMGEIAAHVLTLSTYLKYDPEQSFPCEVESCRQQLLDFRSRETPTPQNIL